MSYLLPLRKSTNARIESLEVQLRASEREWRIIAKKTEEGFEVCQSSTLNLIQIYSRGQGIGNSFTSLDTRISEVAKTAIRTGEQLESLSSQRERASEAHDLILYYNDFAKGDWARYVYFEWWSLIL
jgi:exocyst complex component 5